MESLTKSGGGATMNMSYLRGEKEMSRNKASRGDRIVPCLSFERPGPQNTLRTLEIAASRAEELAVRNIVVASSSGKTGVLAAQRIRGKNLVVVTHSTGFMKPDFQEFKPVLRRKIEALGAKILTSQHAFGGVNRAVRKKFATYELDEIISTTLRTFGDGSKVAIEISLMAADAGLILSVGACRPICGG